MLFVFFGGGTRKWKCGRSSYGTEKKKKNYKSIKHFHLLESRPCAALRIDISRRSPKWRNPTTNFRKKKEKKKNRLWLAWLLLMAESCSYCHRPDVFTSTWRSAFWCRLVGPLEAEPGERSARRTSRSVVVVEESNSSRRVKKKITFCRGVIQCRVSKRDGYTFPFVSTGRRHLASPIKQQRMRRPWKSPTAVLITTREV